MRKYFPNDIVRIYIYYGRWLLGVDVYETAR